MFEFAIARAFWQTWWFRTAVVLGVLGGLCLAHMIRVRQLASRMRMRRLVRTDERERAIAPGIIDDLLAVLGGMKERIEAMGGRFVVESAHGFGTVVELRIPARIAWARSPTGQRQSTAPPG